MPLTTTHIEDTLTSKNEGTRRLLSSILNFNLQYDSNEKYIISFINKLLITAKNRKQGLEYLNIVLDNCSSTTIAENAINWVNHCVIKFGDDVLREVKLRVLGEIIKVAHNESEFNKKFVSDYISKVLENCLTTSYINPYECKAAIKTLTISMQCYPSWFGVHRQKIEDYLIIFLDSENADLVETAGIAFHYLQQVGNAGVNSSNHKLNFTQSFYKLCRTTHKLYNTFFENEKNVFHNHRSNEENVFEFQDNPSNDNEVLMHVNARRIENVLKFIEILIRTKFSVPKETKPKELLEVITRGLSIHKCISGDKIESLEAHQFSLLLSRIQNSLLKLLRIFIVWYQSNCLPFSYSISKTLVDSIERSHNCECFKYDSLYQESSYRALGEWLTISKSSLHPQFQSQILVCILKDITPVKTQITLTISEAASGKKSQKAKRKAMTNRIISSANQNSANELSTNYEQNSEQNTCKFALTVLKRLLELTRLNVKTHLLKDLYKSVFGSLSSIQTSKPSHPYSDVQCKTKLYEVLVAFYHQNGLSCLPPLQTSLDILTRGTNCSDLFISRICQNGLKTLEILCQPICPSSFLGVEKHGEMAVDDDDTTHEEVSSIVDYDTSTDEYSQNLAADQEKDLNDYEVKLPDTDPSLDDGLSDKATINDDIVFEELELEAEIACEQKEEMVSEHPTVTAPSEDGNEVLECQEIEQLPTVREEDKEELRRLDNSEKENLEQQTNQDETEIGSSADVTKTVSFDEVPNVEENIMKVAAESTGNICEQVLSDDKEENKHESPVSKEVEKVEADLQAECEGPPTKKAKTDQDDELDMGDVFNENNEKHEETKKDEDPDSSFLEDDSFVDEVKDYY